MSDRRRDSGRKCPICGKPPLAEYRPFCSKRCADIDLGRWLGGRYRLPAEEPANLGDIAPGDDGDHGGGST